MKRLAVFSTFSAIAFSLTLAGCGETEAAQRERLNRVADEIIVIDDMATQREHMDQELDTDDMAMFSEILNERMSTAHADWVGTSNLTQRLVEYAAIDPVKADRLVALCESELGVSAISEKARLVAQCVDVNW